MELVSAILYFISTNCGHFKKALSNFCLCCAGRYDSHLGLIITVTRIKYIVLAGHVISTWQLIGRNALYVKAT